MKKSSGTRKASREYPPPRTPSSRTSPSVKKRARSSSAAREKIRERRNEPSSSSAFRFPFDDVAQSLRKSRPYSQSRPSVHLFVVERRQRLYRQLKINLNLLLLFFLINVATIRNDDSVNY